LEAQESTPEASCFSVDLFYGDTRVSPNAISVSPERSAGGELRIRVRSSVAVDEPVVTLFVRATCGAAVSRRFVLLSETLTEAESGFAAPLAVVPAPLPGLAPSPVGSALSPSRDSSAASASATRPALAGAPANTTGAERASPNTAEQQAARRLARERAAQDRALRREAAEARASQQGVSEVARQARSSVVRQPERTKTGKPRLEVDLLDLSSSTELTLRGSAELSSAPSEDAAVRRQAQALWRTLNASPEDALRDSQRLETLESQMRTALEQSKRQSQDIASLSTELQLAQRARYLNPFTLFLGLLTLAALALSLVLWRRSKDNSQPWWGSGAGNNSSQDEEHLWEHLVDAGSPAQTPASPMKPKADQAPASGPGKLAARANNSPASSQATDPASDTRPGVLAEKGSQGPLRFVDKPAASVDFAEPSEKFKIATAKITPLGTSGAQGRGGSMGRVDSTPPPSLMPTAAKPAKPSNSRAFGHTDFGSSLFNTPRVVAAEELFDIQEQADFFMSLDQPEQAIEVLKNHITDNVETSALAYMDLFDIYHRTNRQNDYMQLREEFNRVFNAQVPEFSRYGAASAGLEGFPQVLKGIQAGWSQPHQALELIEESIFRQPDQDQPPLDMQAYRELMLLYAMAKELARPHSSYSMLPAATQSGALPVMAASQASAVAPDVDLGLDIGDKALPLDMLSLQDDPTISLPPGLSLMPEAKQPPSSGQDNGLDFDLSDMSGLDDITIPGMRKRS
jgi:pilus assembly protein FimV